MPNRNLSGPVAVVAVIAVIALLTGLAASFAVAGRSSAHEISADARVVLDRMDAAQSTIITLTAEIEETRTLKLLAEPERYRGRLSYERPEKIRWDYHAPIRSSYVMNDGQMTGWIPDRNRVEVVDLSRRQRRLRRLFAIGEDSAALAEEFEITLAERASESGTDELILVPRSRRIRKRVAEVRLWVDREDGLPRQIRYTTGNGDEVVMKLTERRINEALAKGTFELSYPEDAKVVTGFSELTLPGVAPSSPADEL